MTRVIDGDTIDVRLPSGKTERVRIIGVDTPERGSCYATAATAETRRITLRKIVRVVGDRTQAQRDRHVSLLASVAAASQADVGQHLLNGGYARLLKVSRAFPRRRSYRAAERSAQTANVVMWTACGAAQPPPRPAPPRDPMKDSD